MTIYSRQNFYALATLGLADLITAALGRGKRRVDKALTLIDLVFVAKHVRQLGQNLAQPT